MHAVCSISRWFRSWPAAAYCAVLFTIASPTVAASFVPNIVPISVERSVWADAESIAPGLLDFASDLNLSNNFSDYAAGASAVSFLDGLSGGASALQAGSILDPTRVASTGSASASGSASNPDGLGSYLGESFFDLVFEATVPLTFTLSGAINALAFGAGGDADAYVELVQIVDPFTETLLFSSLVLAGDVDPFSVFGFAGSFEAGTQYRLSAGATGTALVDTLVAPSGSGSGSFDFVLDFQAVPEPGTGLLLAMGLGGLLWATRRRAADPA